VVLPELKKGDAVVYELNEAKFDLPDWRVAGTVIPVFSLRSEGSFGVGDFGDLKEMVDWVVSTGQRALQVLPINDTTITNTWLDSYPYKSISIYALHPMFTDIRQLPQLEDKERARYYAALQHELNALPQIDYERVNAAKRGYLRELFEQDGAKMMRTKANLRHSSTTIKTGSCLMRHSATTATFTALPHSATGPITTPSMKASVRRWQTVAQANTRKWRSGTSCSLSSTSKCEVRTNMHARKA
jgi:4-alpha-glucanotransferase